MVPGSRHPNEPGPTGLASELRVGVAVHLPYALFSVVVVCCSVVAGVLSSSVGDGRLAEVPFTELTTGVLTQTRPLPGLVRMDTELVSVLIVGVVTLGVVTALVLVAQGVVVGFYLGLSVGTVGPSFLVVSLAPHGVLRLVGLAFASAVSFRLVVRGVSVLLGRHDRYLTNREWRQTGLVVLAAWTVVVAAAVVESLVTVRLTRLVV